MANEKSTSIPAGQSANLDELKKQPVPEIDVRTRYISNGAAFNLPVPVRFNENLSDAKIANILAMPAFRQAVARAASMQMALAVDANVNFRPVNMPTNILQLAGGVSGTAQNFNLAALAEQARKILELNGAVMGKFASPLRGATFGQAVIEGDTAHFPVTLKNGAVATVSIKLTTK